MTPFRSHDSITVGGGLDGIRPRPMPPLLPPRPARARELSVDNEANPGLGVRYRLPRSERFDWTFDAGAYRDSGRNTALALFDSDTYNCGRTFIAPLPVAAYELGPLILNFVYLPKFRDVNPVAALGFWVTFWPGP